jgi:hypothetical protein
MGVGLSAACTPSVAVRRTPQTIRFRANALNSRGIVGAGNSARELRGFEPLTSAVQPPPLDR